jgi:uncharacterized protein (UPF0548 family)
VFLLRAPSPERLAEIVARLDGQSPTYDEVGATEPAATGAGTEPLPAGYHHQRAEATLGVGDAAWRAAVEGIRTWQMHRRSGFTVVPGDPPIAAGATVLSVIPLAGPVRVLAGCRIVWAVDRPDRFGFGYATLPVHPATGEEAFVVTRTDDGTVTARVTAFSRSRHPLVRLGGPVARRQQASATRGYLSALGDHVAAAI